MTTSSRLRLLRHRLSRTPLRVPLTWYRHRGLDESDVLLASYPRSGNTWLRFLLFELLEGRPAGFSELDAADSVAGQVELSRFVPRALPGGGRLLKTHELWRPEYRRAVYLLRDIRAVLLSEYRFVHFRGFFQGEIDEFVDRFVAGTVNPYGTWVNHYASWRDSPANRDGRVLFVRYESLRERPFDELSRIVDFLGLEADSARVQQAIDDNTVERLREREEEETDPYYRSSDRGYRLVNRGEIRGWKDRLSSDQIARLTELARGVDDWNGYDSSRGEG